MKLELCRRQDTLQVFEEGTLVGEVRKLSRGDYSWTSWRALAPYKHGRCKTERIGLLHLGYKAKGILI